MLYDEFNLDYFVMTPDRKKAFHAVAQQLCDDIKSDFAADPATKLARIFEMIFNKGVTYAVVPPDVREREWRQHRSYRDTTEGGGAPTRFTEDDLPRAVRTNLTFMNLAVGRVDGSRSWAAMPERLYLIMCPGREGQPPSRARDRWFNIVSKGQFHWGNKTIDYLVEQGLYEEPIELADGWKYVCMTEWGYEFFSTGSASLPEDRTSGGSSLFEEFSDLRKGDHGELLAIVASANKLTDAPTLDLEPGTHPPRF